MQLVSKFNKGFRFLLYFICVFSKYHWVVFLKDKKSITNTNAFKKTQAKHGQMKAVNFTIN